MPSSPGKMYDRLFDIVTQAASESQAFSFMERKLDALPTADLDTLLLCCGAIPETIAQNSSVEKNWAKMCDIVLKIALNRLGLDARVIRTRGNSADVHAESRKPDFTLVGDAKAFRLSRTAKNQKDFKVSSLDSWRKDNTYAMLIAPLYQYATSTSQVYQQASAYDVLLYSYAHLAFLLESGVDGRNERIWAAAREAAESDRAAVYWDCIDRVTAEVAKRDVKELRMSKTRELNEVIRLADEALIYLLSEEKRVRAMDRDMLMSELLKTKKIAGKIHTIRQTKKQAEQWLKQESVA